jgi:ubiquitin-conjugating enzyme E2 J1
MKFDLFRTNQFYHPEFLINHQLNNQFEWHFTVRGPPETAFEGGFYHGRLSFPTEYPMKPPSIILLTPNGRFETNKKICLSISGYHPETW